MTSVLFCLVVKSCLTLLQPQAPLSMGFPRWEQWSGLPFHSPGDLHDPGIELTPPALAGGFFTTEPSAKPNLSLPDVLKDYKREITGTVPEKAVIVALVMMVGCSSSRRLWDARNIPRLWKMFNCHYYPMEELSTIIPILQKWRK